jgi:hypothetical protein
MMMVIDWDIFGQTLQLIKSESFKTQLYSSKIDEHFNQVLAIFSKSIHLTSSNHHTII